MSVQSPNASDGRGGAGFNLSLDPRIVTAALVIFVALIAWIGWRSLNPSWRPNGSPAEQRQGERRSAELMNQSYQDFQRKLAARRPRGNGN